MKGVKCKNCARYINEWREKIIDSPYPDIIRDCEHYIECRDDAISRKAVLSYISKIQNQGTGKKKSFKFLKKYVSKMPSVKSKRFKGDCAESEGV